MNNAAKKERYDSYQGMLLYGVANCKSAFRYLGETNDKLNRAWEAGDTSNLNELGQLDRVFKDYLILKIAALFDRYPDSLSLQNFEAFLKIAFPKLASSFSSGLQEIQKRYGANLDRIIGNRHVAVAHFGKKKLDNLIHTQDLLAMSIPELLKDIEDLLASVSSPTFPVR